MNIIQELEDIFSLAEDDEKFAIKRCIEAVKQVQRVRERSQENPVDLDALREKYENHVEWVPREDWPEDVLAYEGYAVRGTVNSSGGCFPGFNVGPTPLGEPEDWGIADVYPVIEPEVEDV